MARYDITNVNDHLDESRASWLRQHLSRDQYTIVNDGFLIDAYYLSFNDPRAETLYLLRWGE
jgi:hypothetical protein